MKTGWLLLALLLVAAGPAGAQTLDILFESEPGVRPAQVFTDGFESGDITRLFDADGDGQAELLLTQDDAQGRLDKLRAVAVGTGDVLAEIQNVQSLLAGGGAVLFRGFADPDGDDAQEAVFVNQSEIALVELDDGAVGWSSTDALGTPPELRLLGLLDMTNDGFPEILVALPEARQVVIFSIDTAAARR